MQDLARSIERALRRLVMAAVLVIALWLSLTPEAQAQTGGYCTYGYVRYWDHGRYITEGRWFCTGWQTPRQWRR
jgi:hypothetical protein